MKFNFTNLVYSLLIIIGIVLLISPFIPEFTFPIQYIYKSNEKIKTETQNSIKQAIEKNENKIIIPKIFVDAKILESNKVEIDKILPEGPTRILESSTPDKGGNTVIVAHRANMLSGPKTFYHLLKIKTGDDIMVVWNEKEYKYKVFNTFETVPTDLKVEAGSEENILTLYTCTPMIDFSRRFVVQAKLIQ